MFKKPGGGIRMHPYIYIKKRERERERESLSDQPAVRPKTKKNKKTQKTQGTTKNKHTPDRTNIQKTMCFCVFLPGVCYFLVCPCVFFVFLVFWVLGLTAGWPDKLSLSLSVFPYIYIYVYKCSFSQIHIYIYI